MRKSRGNEWMEGDVTRDREATGEEDAEKGSMKVLRVNRKKRGEIPPQFIDHKPESECESQGTKIECKREYVGNSIIMQH